jgi:hypothetical protein
MATFKLEDIVARCLADMERGSSLEDCLARYPQQRELLIPLLRTAVRLRTAPRVVPAPALKRSVRVRLAGLIRAGAQSQGAERVVTKRDLLRCIKQVRLKFVPRMRMSPVAWAVSVAAVFIVMGAWVVHTSATSLPGDVLYPAKLATEQTRLLLSPDETRAAELHLSFAEERLEETVALARSGRWEAVQEVTMRYVEEMDAASIPLETAKDGEDLRELLKVSTARHLAMIRTVHEVAPNEIEPFTEMAVSATWRGSERAGFPPPSPPTSRDLDGDGISNAEDGCPYAPGPASVRGCPPLSEDQDGSNGGDASDGLDDGSGPPEGSDSPTPAVPTEMPEPPRPTEPSRPTETPEPTRTPKPPTSTPEPVRPTRTPERPDVPVEPVPPRPTETPTTSDSSTVEMIVFRRVVD